MRNKRYQKFILFFLTSIFFTVSSTKAQSVYEANSEKGRKYLKRVNAVYAPYEKITATFVIKGMVNEAEVYFTGNLKVKNAANGKSEYLSLSLEDSIFESKVYQLTINKGTVTSIDYLNDRKETIPLSRFTWVEVLGSVFPFQFFYPLLSGFPPSEIYSGMIHEQDNKIINTKGKYNVGVTLKNFVIDNVYTKNLSSKEVTVFRLSGNMNKKGERYFPKTIYMERSKKQDHLQIIFKYFNAR